VLAVLRRATDAGRAEDALQEAWIRAARAVSRFDGRSTFRTWLTGIALNCVREERRRPAAAPAPDDEAALLAALPAREAGTALRIDLERALHALPDGYRMVVVLHDVWGYDHAEVAHMLGIEESSSRSQLARARRVVRRWLEGGAR
jgi:RNA polymerase sigma-70 factor (ECF subfamily)